MAFLVTKPEQAARLRLMADAEECGSTGDRVRFLHTMASLVYSIRDGNLSSGQNGRGLAVSKLIIWPSETRRDGIPLRERSKSTAIARVWSLRHEVPALAEHARDVPIHCLHRWQEPLPVVFPGPMF